MYVLFCFSSAFIFSVDKSIEDPKTSERWYSRLLHEVLVRDWLGDAEEDQELERLQKLLEASWTISHRPKPPVKWMGF